MVSTLSPVANFYRMWGIGSPETRAQLRQPITRRFFGPQRSHTIWQLQWCDALSIGGLAQRYTRTHAGSVQAIRDTGSWLPTGFPHSVSFMNLAFGFGHPGSHVLESMHDQRHPGSVHSASRFSASFSDCRRVAGLTIS
jgi:hypothetical protein